MAAPAADVTDMAYREYKRTVLLACMLQAVLSQAGAANGDTSAAAPDPAAPPPVRVAEPVQMDFLSGYYQQDGNHSAVTGGEGTEELKDFSSVIKIYVPLKNRRSLQLDTRMNYFTSASSDNIDPSSMSGASRNDFKIGVDAAVTREIGTAGRQHDKRSSRTSAFTWKVGASHEAHFASIHAGMSLGGISVDGMGEWTASTSYVMDVWGQYYDISKLYPSDYYGREGLDQDKRHTLNAAFSYNRILHPHLQAGFSADIIQQFGLLSTPFHRIYFKDTARIDIERLPGYRFRMPVTARLNWAAADWLFLKTYYRFYWDNFGMKAHSVYLELPVKPAGQFTFYPFYRYHIQYGHEYFAEKGEHLSTETYYTSDFDQSDLHSHYIGGGWRWTPFLANRKRAAGRFMFRSVEARAGYYRRSDGFRSWIVSGGFSWAILRDKEWEE